MRDFGQRLCIEAARAVVIIALAAIACAAAGCGPARVHVTGPVEYVGRYVGTFSVGEGGSVEIDYAPPSKGPPEGSNGTPTDSPNVPVD